MVDYVCVVACRKGCRMFWYFHSGWKLDHSSFLLKLSIMNWRCAFHIDYVSDFSQANSDAYMHLLMPPGFHVKGSAKVQDHCIETKKNLHGDC